MNSNTITNTNKYQDTGQDHRVHITFDLTASLELVLNDEQLKRRETLLTGMHLQQNQTQKGCPSAQFSWGEEGESSHRQRQSTTAGTTDNKKKVKERKGEYSKTIMISWVILILKQPN